MVRPNRFRMWVLAWLGPLFSPEKAREIRRLVAENRELRRELHLREMKTVRRLKVDKGGSP